MKLYIFSAAAGRGGRPPHGGPRGVPRGDPVNGWEAFAASPGWFVVWTVGTGFAVALALRGLAALVVAFRTRGAP